MLFLFLLIVLFRVAGTCKEMRIGTSSRFPDSVTVIVGEESRGVEALVGRRVFEVQFLGTEDQGPLENACQRNIEVSILTGLGSEANGRITDDLRSQHRSVISGQNRKM